MCGMDVKPTLAFFYNYKYDSLGTNYVGKRLESGEEVTLTRAQLAHTRIIAVVERSPEAILHHFSHTP